MKKKVHQFLHRRVCETFGNKEGIFTLDETGFVKSGNDSVGVQRQYTGTVGKVENCQVGTFLGYVSDQGHVLLDRRLYMPKKWCHDKDRRAKAHVPDEMVFQTKPQHGIEMLKAIKEQGFPGSWVTADTAYGQCAHFRQDLYELKLHFVVAVPCDTEVEMKQLKWRCDRRKKQVRYKPLEEFNKLSVYQIAHGLSQKQWKHLRVAPGSKGWREYEWAIVWVRLPETPHQKVRLLLRRSLSDGKLSYYLCAVPKKTPLLKLARVASSRWSIEQCFKETKGETGMDQYQVRTWEGWHRHTLLSMLAHLFLAELKRRHEDVDESQTLSVSAIRRFLEIALPMGDLSDMEKWRWLQWKRKHNFKARISHYKHRESRRNAA